MRNCRSVADIEVVGAASVVMGAVAIVGAAVGGDVSSIEDGWLESPLEEQPDTETHQTINKPVIAPARCVLEEIASRRTDSARPPITHLSRRKHL